MTVLLRHEAARMDETFFENAFKHEMNYDVAETVYSAVCAAFNCYDVATQTERAQFLAKLIGEHDVVEDWLRIAADIEAAREAGQ